MNDVTTTKTSKLPLRQVPDVRGLLINDMARDQLKAVAARHMNPERLMRITANAIRTTPKLQQCEPLSFLGALMQCAALGLEPNTILGHAYLIPFDKSVKNPDTGRWEKHPQVQLVVGYKGLIDLARRSGHITSISANIHYSDDDLWEYEEGTEAKLRHRPGAMDGEKLHAYAIAKFVDGGHAYVVLPWPQVMKIRDGSQGWQSAVKFGKTDTSPWSTHEDAMAKKTAIRALSKYLPLSVEFSDAVTIDQDGGRNVDFAGYALDPASGPMIDGETVDHDDTDTPDENALEEDRKAEEEAKKKEAAEKKAAAAKKAADKKKAEKKAEDAKKAAEKKAEPETVDSEDKGDEGDDGNGEDPESIAAHRKILQDILANLADGADVDACRQFYADDIAAMEKEAPGVFTELNEEFTAHLEAAEEQGDD